MSKSPLIPRHEWLNVPRGFLMGGADIIPGVSGGTVALILGIYERLVTAISRFDRTLLSLLMQRQWLAAAAHIDGAFLLTLGIGIGSGIVCLSGLMHYLLEHQLQPTLAVFFGLILASSWHVARLVKHRGAMFYVQVVLGAIAAYWLVGLPFLKNPPDAAWYGFLCGVIAICAMILPGVSGAFMLLVLGAYTAITGALHDLTRGTRIEESLGTLGIFLLGCGVGLLSFSKLLRWLLDRYQPQTMAVLCGVMLGSLRKIWPFKVDLSPEVLRLEHKQFENIPPSLSDPATWVAVVLGAIAFALVVLLEMKTRGKHGENSASGSVEDGESRNSSRISSLDDTPQ